MSRRSLDARLIRAQVLLGLTQGVPLTVICRRHDVDPSTIWRWGESDREFADQLLSARSLGWDQLAHECLEIADDARNDWMEALTDEGDLKGWRLNGEAVQRSKLRIETRLKLLSVWDGTRYGEKREVNLTATVTERRQVVDPRQLDEADRDALRRVLLAAQAQGLLPPPDEPDYADATDADYAEVEPTQSPDEPDGRG